MCGGAEARNPRPGRGAAREGVAQLRAPSHRDLAPTRGPARWDVPTPWEALWVLMGGNVCGGHRAEGHTAAVRGARWVQCGGTPIQVQEDRAENRATALVTQ